MKRMRLIAAAVFLTADDSVASPITERADAFLARYDVSTIPLECAGPPSRSNSSPEIDDESRRIKDLDSTRIFFEFGRGETFLNVLDENCRAGGRNFSMSITRRLGRDALYCRGDRVRFHSGGNVADLCKLGLFYELKKKP